MKQYLCKLDDKVLTLVNVLKRNFRNSFLRFFCSLHIKTFCQRQLCFTMIFQTCCSFNATIQQIILSAVLIHSKRPCHPTSHRTHQLLPFPMLQCYRHRMYSWNRIQINLLDGCKTMTASDYSLHLCRRITVIRWGCPDQLMS